MLPGIIKKSMNLVFLIICKKYTYSFLLKGRINNSYKHVLNDKAIFSSLIRFYGHLNMMCMYYFIIF